MLKNNVIIALDISGSMFGLKKQAIDYYNNLIKTMKNHAKLLKQKTSVSLIEFSDNVSVIYKNRLINNVKPMDNYKSVGSTSLCAAIEKTIDLCMSNTEDMVDDEASFLVIILTDGMENSPPHNFFDNYRKTKLKSSIHHIQSLDKVTMTIQVPDLHAKRKMMELGFRDGNIAVWETTEEGLEKIEKTTTNSISNYYSSRSRGLRSSNQFYVQPDLSTVTKAEMKKTLTTVNHIFDIISATSTCQIKNLVERNTTISYVKGCAYYQLIKPELVQYNKKIVILDKRDGKLYGGPDARDLIGLPHNVNVKVLPENFSNYEIYIQSTSVNRKILPRTKVLVSRV